MGNFFAQIFALTSFNLRTLPQRRGSAFSAIVGVAGVVAVLVGVLSISQGVRRTVKETGSPDAVIMMRAGADTEMTSVIGRDDVNVIRETPGIAREGDSILVSPELFVIINLPKRSTGTDANVPFRGVESTAFQVRDGVEVVEGRMFEWGRNEVIAGRGALLEFSGLDIGSSLRLGQNEWTVVGVFESNGGLEESEIWTDAAVLQPAYRRGSSYQSALVKLASAGSYEQFKDALTVDPRANFKIQRVSEYYASQSRALNLTVTVLGTLVAGLMGLGAIFGALNTMYTAVAARSREIATLKALGFRGMPVIVSVIFESLVLSAVGGVIGALLAWAAFDGYRAATLNWQSFAQITFAFDVNGPLLMQGIIYAMLIGLVGGLFPAIRAARLPISVALRGD